MHDNLPLLLISMGDPAGIGPEIAVKAFDEARTQAKCKVMIVGDGDVLESAAQLSGVQSRITRRHAIHEAEYKPGEIEVFDMQNIAVDSLKVGEVSAVAGQAAFEYIIESIELCQQGAAQALVTGPINKRALHAAGHQYSGHTEILADYCGSSSVAMLLIAGSLRVSHVTTHISLKEACSLVRKRRIEEVINLTHEALIKQGVDQPSIAVCGLNPHAGESGLFGDEEIREIVPAIESARLRGLSIIGPEPPDTIFIRAAQPESGIDAVVAMYHDQGHIPVKLLGFHDGVNMTLGLPIIRTSVDHGTAFDIAGTGSANPSSLLAAIRTAAAAAACA